MSDYKYRGVLTQRYWKDKRMIREIRTPRTYDSEEVAHESAKSIKGLAATPSTYWEVRTEKVQEILICDDCQEMHDTFSIVCKVCGSVNLTAAEMEVLV